MSVKSKRVSILFLLLALCALILLAGSLSSLELQPGEPVPGASSSEDEMFIEPTLHHLKTYPIPFVQGIIALILTSTLIYFSIAFFLAYRLVSLKIFFKFLLVLFFIALATILLSRISLINSNSNVGAYMEFATPPPQEFSRTPLGTPPPVFAWVIGIILALGLGFPVIRSIFQRFNAQDEEDAILREAAIAVAALEEGQNFSSVIMNCYFEMAKAIQKEEGLIRETFLTVTEFERELVEQGIPPLPIRNLTALFEKVRYGNENTHVNDEIQAIESLKKIIEFCENKGGKANDTR